MKNTTGRLIKIVLLCLIAIIIVLTSCNDDFSEKQQAIYHDDALIASVKDRFSFRKFLSKKQSDQAVVIDFQGFTGAKRVFEVDNAEESTLLVNYNLELKSGEFKLVLVLPDDTVKTICENASEGNAEFLLPAGKTEIKIVGLTAQDGKLDLSYEVKSE